MNFFNIVKHFLALKFIIVQAAGYSSAMKTSSLEDYEYPSGGVWKKLIDEGKFK